LLVTGPQRAVHDSWALQGKAGKVKPTGKNTCGDIHVDLGIKEIHASLDKRQLPLDGVPGKEVLVFKLRDSKEPVGGLWISYVMKLVSTRQL